MFVADINFSSRTQSSAWEVDSADTHYGSVTLSLLPPHGILKSG
jgi:hypothetical protein